MRKSPYPPSFNRIAARIIDPARGASTFLVPAHPGSPGKRVVKWVCVCLVSWGLAPQPTGELNGLVLKWV